MDKTLSMQEAYMKSRKNRRRVICFMRIFLLFAFLFLWEMAARLNWIDSFIFSSPSRVAACFVTMAKDGSVFMHIGVTLMETLVSFFFVIFIGLLFAILLWLSKTASEIAEPYLVVLNSLPKSALAPLLIVWLGTGSKTIIVAGISVAIFGTIMNLYTGFGQVDKEKIKLIYTLGGKKRDVLFKLIIPSTIPLIFSIMKVNIGLALVGVIIGEFLAARRGLGYLIIYGSQVFKLDHVIMSIIILCLIAMALYFSLQHLEKKVKKR